MQKYSIRMFVIIYLTLDMLVPSRYTVGFTLCESRHVVSHRRSLTGSCRSSSVARGGG